MAHDDMHVIMYKILSYLYSCMKEGRKVNNPNISAEALGINHAYWTAIMVQLIERGYVKGYMVNRSDNSMTVVPVEPTVTIDGVEFLMENSMMRRALDFLRDTKDAIPFA